MFDLNKLGIGLSIIYFVLSRFSLAANHNSLRLSLLRYNQSPAARAAAPAAAATRAFLVLRNENATSEARMDF